MLRESRLSVGVEICRQLTRFTVLSAPTPRSIRHSQMNLTLVFNDLYLRVSLCPGIMQSSLKINDFAMDLNRASRLLPESIGGNHVLYIDRKIVLGVSGRCTRCPNF